MAALVDDKGRYTGPIIDSHHHFWDRTLERHPWLRGKNDPVLGQSCLPQDYLQAVEGFDVVASVHIEANWDPADPMGEIDWLDALPRPDGIATRYVAFADLGRAGVEPYLEALAGRERVVGIRDIVSWHPDPARSAVTDRHRMADPRWRAGLAQLAPLDLSFDLLMSPWQIEDALDLVRDFPNQRFAINHCGSPFDRSPEGMAHWANSLRRLAEAPNVVLKISDLVAYDPDWNAESLSSVALTCLDAFGVSRCMLGSDHPVVTFHASFQQTYDNFLRTFAGLSGTEQHALFAGNAAQFYRIPT
ncbi:amidohydrolase family protein [Hoeflea sp. Naph1]|uniref:amidohydrolase family protein n=1 Tax=Hoeflea sp. Naph1 TaxID=3388653 RepID=UPI00398FD5D3